MLFKESEMSKFCQEISILLLRQKEDVESAIINHGPYCLAPKFSHLQVPQDEWFQKNTNQKEACVKEFRHIKMSKNSDCIGVTETASTSSYAEQARIRISVDLVNSGITSLHPATLQCMSRKIKNLINKPNSIVQAPGSAGNSSFLVESDSKMVPHYITIAKSGKITCNECPMRKAQKICAHSLAVAEKIGTTASFLNWLKAKGPTRVNLTALVTCDSSKGVGKKGGKPATARRKRGRNVNKTPPITIVDRQNFLPRSVAIPSQAQTLPPQVSPVQPFPSTRPSTSPQILPVQSSSILQPLFNQTPPLQSCFATPRPQIWPCSPTQPSPINTPQQSFNLLQLCPPLVRSCCGCSQSLKAGGIIVPPPHELVIISENLVKRSFRDPSTLEMRSREGNVYFHVLESCIRSKQRYFIPRMASVPHGLLPHLKAEHMHFLRQFGLHV